MKRADAQVELPELGPALRNARIALGLTQDDVGARTGMPKSCISHYETGRRSPSGPALLALVRALGLRLDLLHTDNDPHETALCGSVRPNRDQVAWVLEHVADHIRDGGSHRVLWWDRLRMPGLPTEACRFTAEAKREEGE